MGKALLFPGWEPERPHYDQIVGEEDAFDFAEVFAELTGETMMDIGGAISAVKQGQKVYREAWTPTGDFIRLEGIDRVVCVSGGTAFPWEAASADLLTEDWRYFNHALGLSSPAGDDLELLGDRPTLPEEKVEHAIAVDTAEAGTVLVPARVDPDETHGDGA